MQNYILKPWTSISSQIRKKMNTNCFFRNFILIFHGLCIIILMVNIFILNSCQQNEECKMLQHFIQNNVLTNAINLNGYYLLMISTIVTGLQIVIIYNIFPDNQKYYTNETKRQTFSIITVGNYILSEITIYPALFYVIQIGKQSVLEGCSFGIIVILSYYSINGTIPNFSLYSKLTPLIILVGVGGNSLSQIFILVITIFEFVKTDQKIRKIIYFFILATVLRILWGQNIGQDYNVNFKATSIYYVLSGVMAFTSIFYFSNIKFISKQETFIQILKITQKIPNKQMLQDWIKLDQIITIFAFVLSQVKQYAPHLTQEVQQSLRHDIKAENFHEIILSLLNQISNKHSSCIYKLLYLEYKILTKKSLILISNFIQKSNLKPQKMAWNQRIMHFQLVEKLIFNYGYFNETSQLRVKIVINADDKINTFGQCLQKIILLQVDFWEYLLNPKINYQKLCKKFAKIENLRIQMNKKDKQLKKLEVLNEYQNMFHRNQQKILQYQSLNQDWTKNQFQKGIISIKSSTMDQTQLLDKNVDSYLIVLSNDKISSISSTLAHKLGINKTFLQNAQYEDLFGREFAYYLKQKINDLDFKKNKQWIYLPLFKNQFCFTLTVAMIYWYPSMDGKTQYLIKVSFLITKTCIIYNTSSNLITGYNYNFLSDFKLSFKHINSQMNKDRLTFESLCDVQFIQIFPNFRLVENENHNYLKFTNNFFVKHQMCFHNFLEQKNGKFQGFSEVIFRIYGCINMNWGKLVIIQLHQSKNQQKNLWNCNSGEEITISNQMSQKNKYKNENPFQPIKINYSDEINQKFATLKIQGRFKRFITSFIMILVLTFFSISANIVDLYFFQDRVSSYNSMLQLARTKSDGYITLYRLYKAASKNYQYLVYPNNIVQTRGVSVESIIAVVKANQRQFLDNFISKYMLGIQFKTKKIQYDLVFDRFNITTNTDLTTLMDFAVNFNKNLLLNQYDFILQNYQSFRQLVIDFEESLDLKDAIQLWYKKTINRDIACISVIVILFAIIFLIQNKNRKNIQKLIKVYTLIQDKHIIKKVNELKSYNLALQQKKNSKNLSFYQSISLFNQQSSKIQQVQTKLKKSLKNDVQDKQLFVPKLNKLTKYIIYMGLLCVYFGMFGIEYYFTVSEQQIALQTINYQSQIYKRMFELNRMNSDMVTFPAYRHKYNKSLELMYNNIDIFGRIETVSNFPQIKSISQKINYIMEDNICRFPMTIKGIELIPCESFGNQVLTRGYSDSYAYLLGLVEKVKQLDLNQFNSEKCTEKYCPSYYVFDEIISRLNILFENVFVTFSQWQIDLFSVLTTCFKKMVLEKMVIQSLTILGLSILIIGDIKRSFRALQMFAFFPKDAINSIKTTKYLRDNNILDHLDQF